MVRSKLVCTRFQLFCKNSLQLAGNFADKTQQTESKKKRAPQGTPVVSQRRGAPRGNKADQRFVKLGVFYPAESMNYRAPFWL
jgi:hypothetical protein